MLRWLSKRPNVCTKCSTVHVGTVLPGHVGEPVSSLILLAGDVPEMHWYLDFSPVLKNILDGHI